MGKAQGKAKSSKAPHSHFHSRISFLYQAARLLSNAQVKAREASTSTQDSSAEPKKSGILLRSGMDIPVTAKHQAFSEEASHLPDQEPKLENYTMFDQQAPMARQLISHLKGVSLKSQIRLSPVIKHSICKKCNTLLAPGSSSSTWVENKSRGGKKPWADVMVIRCRVCDTDKRFPVGSKKQVRRTARPANAEKPVNLKQRLDDTG